LFDGLAGIVTGEQPETKSEHQSADRREHALGEASAVPAENRRKGAGCGSPPMRFFVARCTVVTLAPTVGPRDSKIKVRFSDLNF
jgi:hypothetical protein